MIFVVIPSYNEGKILPLTVAAISAHLKKSNKKHLIIIVDDASSDSTAEVVVKLSKRLPVRLIRHKTNRGPGKTIETGLKKAIILSRDKDIIVTIEADNTNDASILPQLIKHIETGFDVVCASRTISGGSYEDFPLSRTLLSRGANLLLKTLYPIENFSDYTIFFRAYKSKCIKKALDKFKGNLVTYPGFVGNVEIIVKLRSLGIKASEIPMIYRYKHRIKRSHMKVIKNLFDYASFLNKYWRLR